MARVKKIDNAILKRRARQIEKEQRKYAFLPQREKILIVTEGERTEPNYFEGFKTIIPRGILHVEVIGTGFNTVQVETRTPVLPLQVEIPISSFFSCTYEASIA